MHLILHDVLKSARRIKSGLYLSSPVKWRTETHSEQESTHAWTQEAYRPPRSSAALSRGEVGTGTSIQNWLGGWGGVVVPPGNILSQPDGGTPPPKCEQTDTCENITFQIPRNAGGNYDKMELSAWTLW